MQVALSSTASLRNISYSLTGLAMIDISEMLRQETPLPLFTEISRAIDQSPVAEMLGLRRKLGEQL